MSTLRAVMIGSYLLLQAAGQAEAQWWGGCRDALGTPVLEYPDLRLPDIAMASIVDGRPVIIYNPQVVLASGPQTRRFFYFHECGHHALGQVLSGVSIPFRSEQEADCWAARELVDSGEFTRDDLVAVGREVSRSPGDWSHLPGPQRALNLLRCIDDVEPAGRCRTVTDWEERTTWQTRMAQQRVPCSHPMCSPWGCSPAHAFDVIPVPQQVPVTTRIPVTRMQCD